MSPHRDGSYELFSVCVKTLAGINAELSGVDLFFEQRNDTIFNGAFLLCLRIEHSYVVGGGEADNVQNGPAGAPVPIIQARSMSSGDPTPPAQRPSAADKKGTSIELRR